MLLLENASYHEISLLKPSTLASTLKPGLDVNISISIRTKLKAKQRNEIKPETQGSS